MTIRTKAGTLVRIIRKLPSFQCNGQETPYVRIENIDERSVTRWNTVDVRLDILIESKPGEIAEAMKEGIK